MTKSSNFIFTEDIEKISEDLKNFYDEIEGKTILIAGGRGFLGTYFVNTIKHINTKVSKPLKIFILDNLITSKEKTNTSDPNITFLEQDISQSFDFPNDLHYIIHAASIASPSIYRKFPIKTVDVNYQGTRNLLEIARKKNIKSMLYLSSSEIYGDPEIIPTPESYLGRVSCTGPRACYDESKRLAETICMLYHQKYDVSVTIARPFNVYGPFLNLDDGRMIPDFMKNAIEKSEIIIHSDGTPTRSFCYVSDAIEGFFRILFHKKSGLIFNVGNDEEISVLKVAEKIKHLINKSIKIKLQKSTDPDYTVDNPQRRCPDLTKIKQIGYNPKVTLDDGLKRLHSWYLGN